MTKLITRRAAVAGAAALAVSGCASGRQAYDGPEVTRIAVFKARRQMYLLNHRSALEGYDIDLGFEPIGDKKIEGDGKTPEGHYRIDRRNPNSRFHLSLGIDYPRAHDVAEAKALGQSPGGDIFIHGRGNPVTNLGRDWTWGCIAVTNDEMEDIYWMVRTGTLVSIYP